MANSANRKRLHDGFTSLMRIAHPHSIEIRGDALSTLRSAFLENFNDEPLNIHDARETIPANRVTQIVAERLFRLRIDDIQIRWILISHTCFGPRTSRS